MSSHLKTDQDEKPKRKRVVLCLGAYCNIDRRAKKLYEQLQPLLDEINGDAYPPPIKLETANCLSMCGVGPNLIIYPDALTFNGLNAAEIERIVREYLQTDTPQGP